MTRLNLLTVALLLGSGCATGARTRMGAALDYVRAFERGDAALYAQTVDREKYEYIAARPGHPRAPLVLKFDNDEQALKSIATYGALSLSSLRVQEGPKDLIEVAFDLEVSSRREKLPTGGVFTVASRWRMTLQEANGTFKVTRVEELPGTSGRGHQATFGHVKALHGGGGREIGSCKPKPCDGVEFVDAAGRVVIKEIWKVVKDGEWSSDTSSVVDGEGKAFANYGAAK